MKTCTKCGEEKPLADFTRDKSKRDGRRPSCRGCRASQRAESADRWRKYSAAYYAEHREQVIADNAEYRAANGAEIHARRAAWRAENPDKVRESNASFYARNQDEQRERARAWAIANPHTSWESGYRVRARKHGHEPVVESFTRDDVIDRYGDACAHCGGPFEELDHYPVPVALGGPHSLDNAVPSCMPCNRANVWEIRRALTLNA